MMDLLAGIVTSKTRIKILVRLFANPRATSHLRGLSDEFEISTNAVREELNRLTKANLLTRDRQGRQIQYRANQAHPLFNELTSMVKKTLGINRLISHVVKRVGKLHRALLVGDYAEGRDTGIIDLVLVGELDKVQVDDLVSKAERHIGRKVRTLLLTDDEYLELEDRLFLEPVLALWEENSNQA